MTFSAGRHNAVVDVPDAVEQLADELRTGAVAVVVGGSRALGEHRPDSDWDLGLYYRGDVDLTALAGHGEVHPPGSWGRIMNGGAWLTIDGLRVDVLLRDLDAVEAWAALAGEGRFEVDGLLGYVAGIPTYSLLAEVSVAVPLRGRLDVDATFPSALGRHGPGRWRLHRDFSLYHARAHAERGNTAAAAGQVGRAVLEEAHARSCEQLRWALNEKHVLRAAGMGDVDRQLGPILASIGTDPVAAVDAVRALVAGDDAPPAWSR